MSKITIIGAGGFVFPFRLIGDLLSFPALRDSHLCLMDVSADRLSRTASAARELIAHYGLPAGVEETTDRRTALRGADYVIITFQVGGIDSYRHDVEIPRAYGIDQPVGDTIGPGGVFRFLRSVTAYDDIAADALELCPNAQVINYANPMAMASWYLSAQGLRTVGLCHSVQGTTRMLARSLDVPYEEVSYLSAGINHQAWVLSFRRGQEDLYPRLRQTMRRRHLAVATGADLRDNDRDTHRADLRDDHGDHSGADRGESTYEGGDERVRTMIMDAFGFFQTESSHHASEYVPFFRKTPALVDGFIPRRWDYFQICSSHDNQGQLDDQLAALKEELTPSVEYGAEIINSIETKTQSVIYGNVPNAGLISNLPAGCCVEVPCLVDGNGVQPVAVGALPTQCAAVNRTNVNVQQLAVEAALTGKREHIYHAVMMDPLTGALLTLDRIHAMVDELIDAHADLLPPDLVKGN